MGVTLGNFWKSECKAEISGRIYSGSKTPEQYRLDAVWLYDCIILIEIVQCD